MIDRERVIKGLRCHVYGHPHTRCYKCPYWGTGPHGASECNDLVADAFALLKEQEKEISKWHERWQRQKDTIIELLGQKPRPRLMTICDLYGYDMGFYESRDEGLVLPVLISRGGPDDDETVGFIRKDGYELRKDCGLMNITWRIWTACPSDELRKETPWD